MHFFNNNHVFKKLGNRKKTTVSLPYQICKTLRRHSKPTKLERRYCTLVVYNIWQTHRKYM